MKISCNFDEAIASMYETTIIKGSSQHTNETLTIWPFETMHCVRVKKKLTEKSTECHNHKPQPAPDTKRKKMICIMAP